MASTNLVLDQHGNVAEGTGENLFVMRDGIVKTPPTVNILAGITRRAAIDILARDGIQVHGCPSAATPSARRDHDRYRRGITPIREVDRREVGDSPIAARASLPLRREGRGRLDEALHHDLLSPTAALAAQVGSGSAVRSAPRPTT